MNDRSLDHLHPDMKPLCEKWLDSCRAQGLNVFLTETYRSSDRQNELYAQGRTKPGRIVTNAKGGQSKHNFTLNGKPASKAFDWAVKNKDGSVNWDPATPPWRAAASIGRTLGMVYGGDWRMADFSHFEIPT